MKSPVKSSDNSSVKSSVKRVRACVGMRVKVPKYEDSRKKVNQFKGTIVAIEKNYALVHLDVGYNESFYIKELKCISMG